MNDIPAILGGAPAVEVSHQEMAAATAWPNLGTDELAVISRLFNDRNISTHPVIGELEDGYRELTGRRHGVAHCNGTTALMAAFWSLDLQPGDQIFVTSAAFWASVLPMMWMGLVPIFCETDPATLSLDLHDLRQKWTPKVKAMVVVPLWGVPPDYDALLSFAAEHGMKVVEDASHAHGASHRGKPCGSFGDVSVFSLQGDKLAPAGEGGVLLTDDDEIRERVICFGDITRILHLDSPAQRFAATSFGVKSRIAPVSAAIGLCQLRKLEVTNQIRRENLQPLSLTLADFGFETYPNTCGTERVYFEYLAGWRHGPLDPAGWRHALEAEGCEVGLPRYPLLHQQPFFTEGAFHKILRIDVAMIPDYAAVRLPSTEKFNGSMLKFPVFTAPAPKIVAAYQHAIRKVGAHQAAIAQALGDA